jgi:hypothetical protein
VIGFYLSISSPFVGVPASLGPGLRTVSGAKWRRDGGSPSRTTPVSTLENAAPESPPSVENALGAEGPRRGSKPDLALAIAVGTPIADWARLNHVPRRTAFRWAKERKVRAAAEAHRRQAIDRAVGRMAESLGWVTDGIAQLARGAASESVKLSALRSVVSDMMAVSKFGSLEDRVTELEEVAHARTRNKSRAH